MKYLFWKTYLSVIRESVGSKEYRHFFVEKDGEVKDILDDGRLSCAYFVSSILYRMNFIKEGHTTVSGLINDLKNSAWKEVSEEELEEGDLIVWDEKIFDSGELHGHIGVYIGNNEAISHSDSEKVPVIHSYNYDGTRKIIHCFRYEKREL